MSTKTLDPVQPEDETKPTGDQDTVLLDDDEESTEDISEEDDDSTENDDDEGEEDGKKFKTRKERAEFFKRKKQEESKKGDGDVLKRSEFYKTNETKAIRLATTPSNDDDQHSVEMKQDIDANWKDIVPFFNRSTDRSDPEVIEQAIYDAHAAWRRRNPKPLEDKDTASRKRLMRDEGIKGSSAKGASAEKKSILGKPSKGMSDWYPAEE